MECKSIVQSSSSSPSTTWKYDVFVSFRGEDIRNNFADHLFAAFQRKGIVVFRDDRSIKQGDHISTELMQAIEGSQVLTVIFSKNYATSSWCLHELAKIVDCMKVRGQIVLPVFYDVSPSEVRKQSGNYGEAFAELEERFEQDQVQQWTKALQQVADLCGCDVQKKIHDMLRELGMKIVRQNAPNDPRKWSRVWCLEDFHMIMFEEEGMDSIEAIKLPYRNPSSEPTLRAQPTLRADALSKMNRLKLLIVEFDDISGSLNYLSSELRYLYWSNYPFTYFPSNCELNHLVELRLPSSLVKQLWEGIKPLYKLKVMDLHSSRNLVKTPDLSGTPNLERLILKGCTKLMQIDPSIGLLRKLVYLNLENCTSLTSLPNSIFGVSSLQGVNLRERKTQYK